MRNPRIFTNQSLHAGATVELEENAARHLVRVLRLKAGQIVILFNGAGGEYSGELADIGKNGASVHVTGFDDNDRESPLKIHLAIGISRGERMDLVVQKATELGVTSIQPLFCERSEVKLSGQRLDRKLHHWQQIAISACEQCQRNRVPSISSANKFSDWLALEQPGLCFVLHHRTATSLAEVEASPQEITLLVGPEGGLSEAEIAAAESAGFQSLALGPRVLRTETAPLAALAILQARWGDMG